ncbi:MAG TPA: FHA domain-containing protein [Planctomycetota bacterium]|nr:FHA domain-containing protein [Planctomycetota bacterium]
MPTLLLYYPEKEKRWKVEVKGQSFTIGRARDAAVSIPHASVSKKHVLVERRGSRYAYRDLGSRNGTYVNTFRRDQGILDDGDELRIGSILVTFYSEKAPPRALNEMPAAPLALGTAPASLDETEVLGRKVEDPQGTPPPPTDAAPAPDEPMEPDEPLEASAVVGEDLQPAEDPQPAVDSPPAARRHATVRPLHSAAPRSSARLAGAVPRPGPVPRRISPRAVVLGIVGCLGVGLVLGYLGTLIDPPRDGGTPLEPALQAPGGGVLATNVPVASEAPQASPSAGPLGPPAAIDDRATSVRLRVRLFLDLAGRPPFRDEMKELEPLSLEKLWDRISSRRTSTREAHPREPGEIFRRLMGREATRTEEERLLEEAKDDPEHFAFAVGTSADYANAARRRRRTDEQLALSLFCDLRGTTPTAAEEEKVLQAVRLAGDKVGSVAKALLGSEGSRAGPRKGEPPEAWVRDAYSRLLLRDPSTEEARAAETRLKTGPEAWRDVLLEIVTRAEYLEY